MFLFYLTTNNLRNSSINTCIVLDLDVFGFAVMNVDFKRTDVESNDYLHMCAQILYVIMHMF